ncbi:hypothetical protein C8N37_11244 [Sphingobacterium faecium]|nr:hypothetical protein C8N37_11244 [Sphingobacterium faecium]
MNLTIQTMNNLGRNDLILILFLTMRMDAPLDNQPVAQHSFVFIIFGIKFS